MTNKIALAPKMCYDAFDLRQKMKNEYEDGRDELAEKKKMLIEEVNKGINSNIPLRKEQKKYLKNMLLFVILRTSKSKSANPLNLQKIVNRAFKKLFVRMIFNQSSEEDLDEDEEFYDHNFIVNLNNIQANDNKMNLNKISSWISPKNIMTSLKEAVSGLLSKKALAARKEVKVNHRETPEEILARKRMARAMTAERQKLIMQEQSREFENQMENMMRQRMYELERGERSRH